MDDDRRRREPPGAELHRWLEGRDGPLRHAHRHERREERRSERRGERDLTPEERAYREARRRANAKLSFITHFVAWFSTCFFLLFVAGFRAAFIVALSWGIGLAMHGFAVVIAPGLRQRWIDREVTRQVRTTTSEQRRELRGEHARNLEQLSASIAHEIRNPITAAKSLVQQMGEDPRAADNVEYAKVALEELDRVERSISHLLRFARDEDVELRPIRIADVLDAALDLLRERAQRLGVALECTVDGEGELLGDAEKLRRVLLNLLGNALDALEQARTPAPRLELAAGENLAGSEVWVRVRDNGPGIEPERLARIFQPFYTSKRDGTGLGLAISKKLVEAHGGTIDAHSVPGAGCEFVLTLPKRRAAAGAPA
jgi:signal transduction histidine kinase